MASVSRAGNPTEWDVAMATGMVRVGAAAALWRWSGALIRMAGGSPDDALLRGVFRYFAVRDLALGLRTLVATRPGGDVARVVTLQGVADTVDAGVVGALVATGRLSRVKGGGAVGLAAGTALAEYATAWRLRRARAASR
jgi:hypothetical protein